MGVVIARAGAGAGGVVGAVVVEASSFERSGIRIHQATENASRRSPAALNGCATGVASDSYHPTPSRETLSMKDGKAMVIDASNVSVHIRRQIWNMFIQK